MKGDNNLREGLLRSPRGSRGTTTNIEIAAAAAAKLGGTIAIREATTRPSETTIQKLKKLLNQPDLLVIIMLLFVFRERDC